MLEFKGEELVKKEIERLNRMTRIISFIRLILAVNLVVWAVCLFSLENYVLYGVLTAVSCIVMFGFIFFTNRFFKELSLNKKKANVYLLHHKRRKLDFSSFVDEGRDYLNKADYKLSDLDIFGSKSLFQYINVCKTKPGRDALAKQLTDPVKKDKGFTNCIYQMAQREETLELEAGLMEFDESAKHINYEEFNSIFKHKISIKPLYFLPLISFAGMLIYFILVLFMELPSYPLIGFVVANYVLARVCLNNDVFELDAFKYYNLCEAYQSLSLRAVGQKLNDAYYEELKKKITGSLGDLNRVKKIYLSLSSRRNFIANLLLNGLAVYDFWLIIVYNRMILSVQTLDELFAAIAEIEVMTSFSTLGIDHAVYAVPKENPYHIRGEEMYHPLVQNCVCNDFLLQGGVVLTGSNMSGKTTFMRTMGINQILFNAGSIVCAREFSSAFIPVYTSLRANDMLSEGISTFYAEILRMKRMNEAIQEGKCLILVDEIFKGTNAYERIQASLKVIEKFNRYGVLFIISTHDFELCEAKNILNYHFNEQYIEDKITFDYKIKEGMCESSNALYLLKMSGII